MAAPTSTNEVTARKLSSSISALWTKIKSTFQPVADRVTSWSSTPSDAKYPSEKLVKDSLDEITGDYRTKDQDISKGANLVVNGSGTMMSNYNFSDCTFVADTDLPVGIAGAFHRSYNNIFHNEFIQLNTEKAFYAEAWYRVKTANKSTVRLSLACYDIDKNAITAENICYGAGSLTELTQNLNPGDTVVHLADLSNSSWKSETTYHKGFIFWNYVNSLGYTYPPETYSRNVYPKSDSSSLWEDSTKVDEVNGTITLKSPWSGPVVPAGTKVSRRGSGSTYYYISSSASAGASTEWTKLSGKFSGFASGGTAIGAFRQGAAFFKLSWINTYTSGNEWIEFAGIELRELPDRIATARKLKTNLARTADSTFDGSADQTNIPVTGTLPVGNGGTGATTAIGAEYNILNQVADIDTTLNGDRKIALCNQTKSASNGVFRWIKLNNVWTWIKGLLSSESGVNISGTASGLSSTLAVGSGGTGKTTVTAGNYVVGAGTSALTEKTPKDAGSDVLKSLDTDNGDVVDGDFIVTSYHVNASTISASTFVRRTALNLWNYIKSKLSGSDVNIGGNAATATNATTADTAKAYDPTFSGTNSIASALESKVTEIAFTEGNASAATDLTNVVLCGLKYTGSSLSSGRLSFTLSVTIDRGASSKGGILRVDLAIGSDGSIYCKRASLTARSGGLDISEFRLVTGTNGGKPVVGVVWNGTTTSGAYMDVRVIDYMALSASASFVYDAVLSNVSIVVWGSSNAIQSASDSDVVHISGSETITGAKEFSRSGQETNFTDSSGSESIVRARTSTSSNNGSCQLNADRTTHRFGVYGRNENGTSKWVSFVGNDGVVNLGSYGDEVRIGGTKFVFNASQLGTEANTFYWI